jgi:hypothetical protein
MRWSSMPSSEEPYRLRVWQKISDPGQLKQDERVRLVGTDKLYSARLNEQTESGVRLREILELDPYETGRNVFYKDATQDLAEAGLLERLLMADVRMYDVWANENRAYSYRGNDTWLDLIEPSVSSVTSPRSDQLPDDLALVWRRKDI